MQQITWFASLLVLVVIVSTGGCSSGKLEGADAGGDAAGGDGLAPEDGTAQDSDAGGDDGGFDAEDDGEPDGEPNGKPDGEDGADGGDETPLQVYYIDFENGDDSNDGLSTETAFKHIPGTRTGSIWNSSYVTTDFGQGTLMANQSRIPPGTHLRIKSGSVHDGTSGGSILIGPDFYQSGTAQEPVVIERDATWGSGPVVIDGDSVPLDQYDSMLYVHRLDHVWIRGNGASGIIIRNSPRNGINLRGNADKDAEGLRLQDILVEGFSGFGAAADYVSGYEIISVELDGKSIAGNGGFHFGEHPCNHGVFQSCIAHHLGDEPGAQSGGTDVQIGFWLVNSQNVTYRDCTAYSNEGDGYDVGLVDASEQNATDNVRYINCTSYDNADGYGANAGEGLSHDVKIYYINSSAHENVVGFHAYGGTATYHYVHSLAHDNKNVNFHIGPDGWNDGTQVTVVIYNSIGYKPDSGDDFHKANLLTTYIRGSSFNLDSDYNFWEYKDITLDSNFCCWDCYAGDNPYVSEYTYENGPGSTTTGWYTINEDGHLHCDGHSHNAFLGHRAAFRDEANHDYHLTPSSDLRGAGLDLTTRPWFLEEMGYDRDGKPRSSWDIGPYEYNP